MSQFTNSRKKIRQIANILRSKWFLSITLTSGGEPGWIHLTCCMSWLKKEEHPVYLYECLSGVCECMWVLRVKAELVRYSGNLSFILGVGLSLVLLRELLKTIIWRNFFLSKYLEDEVLVWGMSFFGCYGFLLHQRYTISIFVNFILP